MLRLGVELVDEAPWVGDLGFDKLISENFGQLALGQRRGGLSLGQLVEGERCAELFLEVWRLKSRDEAWQLGFSMVGKF